jgi:hypothetical protein
MAATLEKGAEEVVMGGCAAADLFIASRANCRRGNGTVASCCDAERKITGKWRKH